MEMLCCSCKEVYKNCCDFNVCTLIALLGIIIVITICIIAIYIIKYHYYKKEYEYFISQKYESSFRERLDEINKKLEEVNQIIK